MGEYLEGAGIERREFSLELSFNDLLDIGPMKLTSCFEKDSQKIKQFELEDLLNLYSRREILGMEHKILCDTCKKIRPMRYQTLLAESPNLLILNLKRYKIDEGGSQTGISLPISIDLSKFFTEQERGRTQIYELYAMCNLKN